MFRLEYRQWNRSKKVCVTDFARIAVPASNLYYSYFPWNYHFPLETILNSRIQNKHRNKQKKYKVMYVYFQKWKQITFESLNFVDSKAFLRS